MKLESIEYLRRLGIDAWIERGSKIEGDSRQSAAQSRLPTGGERRSRIPAPSAKPESRGIERGTVPDPAHLGEPVSNPKTTENSEEPFKTKLQIHIHENVCIIDSLGMSQFVDDLIMFVANFKAVTPNQEEFEWPNPTDAGDAIQDHSLDAAMAGFAGFFHYSVMPWLNVSSRKLLLVLIGLKAIQIVKQLDEYPSDVMTIESLPTNANDKRELWLRLVQMTT